MRVLVIVGSEKIDGNTDKLCKAFISGAAENGNTAVRFHLGEHHINGCRGCNACRAAGKCVIDDGFSDFLEEFRIADIVVFATPLYFWGISSQLKALIDRFYSIGVKSEKGYYSYPKKKCMLLVTAADRSNHFWTFESVENYYHRFVKYMNWENLGEMEAGSCGGSNTERCIEETDWLLKAHAKGSSLG